MKTTTQHIRDHLLSNFMLDPVGDKTETIDELKRTEWNQQFETYMRNRLLIGRFRYESFTERTTQYDRVSSCVRRLQMYQETNNLEFLVDIANLCMVEFDDKSGEYYFDSIDDGQHVEKVK